MGEKGGGGCEPRTCVMLCGSGSALGWSDFHFFAIFENGHMAIHWLYFYEFNSKKSANFAACKRQSFNFLKITGTLKMQYIFLKV